MSKRPDPSDSDSVLANSIQWDSKFARSRWFKRGWTLQDLIAPINLIFYSKEWTEVGTKSTLQETLTEITGIDPGILIGTMDLEYAGVVKRMS